jgi:hypothetical protein
MLSAGGDLEDGGVTSRMGRLTSPPFRKGPLFSPAKARAPKNASFVSFFVDEKAKKDGVARITVAGVAASSSSQTNAVAQHSDTTEIYPLMTVRWSDSLVRCTLMI